MLPRARFAIRLKIMTEEATQSAKTMKAPGMGGNTKTPSTSNTAPATNDNSAAQTYLIPVSPPQRW